MNKKILSVNLKDMSYAARIKLLELYKYASINGIEDIILFSNNILDKNNMSLKELVSLIPDFDPRVRTYLFLGAGDSFNLSANDYSRALEDRSNLEISLDNYISMRFGDMVLNFCNETADFEVGEEGLYTLYSRENINVLASDDRNGYDKQALLSGRIKVFVGPLRDKDYFQASCFEIIGIDEEHVSVKYEKIISDKDNDFYHDINSNGVFLEKKGNVYTKMI